MEVLLARLSFGAASAAREQKCGKRRQIGTKRAAGVRSDRLWRSAEQRAGGDVILVEVTQTVTIAAPGQTSIWNFLCLRRRLRVGCVQSNDA